MAKSPTTPKQLEKYLYWANQNLSAPQIAEKFGTTHQIVYNALKRAKFKFRSRSEQSTKYKCNLEIFKNIDSVEKAYWLGFIYADGAIQLGDNPRLKLTLAICDVGHVQKFKDFLKAEQPLRFYTSKEHIYKNKVIVERQNCEFVIYGQEMVDGLIKNGRTQLKKDTNFPNIPDRLISHFIRGIFDGDGSFSCLSSNRDEYKDANFQFLGSYTVLSGITKYLSSLECFTSPKIRALQGNGEMFTVNFHGNKNVRKLIDLLYSDSDTSIRLDRKHDKIQEFLNWLPASKHVEWPSVEEMKELVKEKCLWDIAQKFGTNQKAVFKFCKRHSIATPKGKGTGFWKTP